MACNMVLARSASVGHGGLDSSARSAGGPGPCYQIGMDDETMDTNKNASSSTSEDAAVIARSVRTEHIPPHDRMLV